MSDEQQRFTFKLEERASSPFWQARIYLAGEGGRERRWSTGVPIGRGSERRQSARVAARKAEGHAASIAAAAAIPAAETAATSPALKDCGKRMLAGKEADRRRARAVDALAFNLEKHVEPFFGKERDVTTIRRADLEAFKQQLSANGLAPSSINNALTAIRQTMKYACTVDELMEAVPLVENVELDLSDKWMLLTPDQVQRWIDHVDLKLQVGPEARSFLLVLANTGIRRTEALSIRWPWIDWQERLLHVPARANKRGRRRPAVALNDAAIGALRERQALHHKRRDPSDDRVFRNIRLMETECAAAAVRAGLEGVRRHDLRHTLGSLHVAKGATLTEVRDTLGQSTMTMVNRYQHSYLERRRETADQVQLGGVIRASDPGVEVPRGEQVADPTPAKKPRRGLRAVPKS